MLILSHAFSRKNAGDGLLVDLSLELLEQSGIRRDQCRLLALDAESFGDLPDVQQVPGELRPTPSSALLRAVGELGRVAAAMTGLGPSGSVARLMRNATGVVAVGGGYLVTDSVVRSGGVVLNHWPQILEASRKGVPTIYLPQSIGPLAGPVGGLVRRALSQIDVVYVRDDESMDELHGVTDVRRCPDLAVLALAESLSVSRPAGKGHGATYLVVRDLPRAAGYVERLHALRRTVPDPRWPVQADVAGPRSDRYFLQACGLPPAGRLADVLENESPGVVVSVRLHGAIAALLAGWPAIHLSYERKGWGAYQDLGLAEWVHDARSFDVLRVRQQVRVLHEDASAMFSAIAARVPVLRKARLDLIGDLRRRLNASGT